MLNAMALGASSLAGFLLATAVPARVRGEYAGVQSWFWVCLVLGEIGIPEALTYYAAREPDQRFAYLKAARRLLFVSGVLTSAVALVLVPTLARGDRALGLSYALVFISVPGTMLLGTYTFLLQATSIGLWNMARAMQPLLYLAGMATIVGFHLVGLVSAAALLVVSVILGGILAMTLTNVPKEPSPYKPECGRRLRRFGLATLLGSGPALVTMRIDQVVLSTFASLSGLGQYAVAVSITGLVVPFVSALGQVGLPRLARARHTGEDIGPIVRRITLLGPLTASLLAAPLYLGTRWLSPHVLGGDYSQVPYLVLLLLPGTVGLATAIALGDVLRGLGRPQLAGAAQGIGAFITVVGLALLVPTHGVAGAAIVSSAAYCTVWAIEVVLVRSLVAGRRRSGG